MTAVTKTITVSPSTRPAQIQMFYLPTVSETPMRIKDGDEISLKAGECIKVLVSSSFIYMVLLFVCDHMFDDTGCKFY